MGAHYDPALHRFRFETGKDIVHLRTVRDFEEAKTVALELKNLGVGAMEICGAFGQEKAAQLTEITDREVAIGYVVHDSVLDDLFAKFFG